MVRNVWILVAIEVSEEGNREVLGVSEGAKEYEGERCGFLRHFKERELKEVALVISDACVGLLESVGEVYPEGKWQRRIVHFYRNAFYLVPRGKIREVAAMLKGVHASEDREAAVEKANGVIQELQEKKLAEAAEKIISSVHKTLAYHEFCTAHWRRIQTNNPLERVLREVRRRRRVVGAFPDRHLALMLAAARLRHFAGIRLGIRAYLNMELPKEISQVDKMAA